MHSTGKSNPGRRRLDPGHQPEKAVADKTPAAPDQHGALVYACSGCSDAGELADRIARRLAREGVAQMACLAGIGGLVQSHITRAKAARRILVIDGCPLACARHTFERAGFQDFEHLKLHEIGLRKGACAVDDRCVSMGTHAARQILRRQPPSHHAADQ